MIATLPPVGLIPSLFLTSFPLGAPMPRIRSIKPEALQHRKVGRLTDREFRLWIGMLTQADDEGRLAADTDQLRVLIFGYHPRVRGDDVESALGRLENFGLVRLYEVVGVRYADFPSWADHQKISHPIPSKHPPFQNLLETSGNFQNLPELSSSRARGSDRSDLKDRREGIVRGGPQAPRAPGAGPSAPSPERLAPGPARPEDDERWPAFRASRQHKTEEQARREFDAAIRKQKTPLAKRH